MKGCLDENEIAQYADYLVIFKEKELTKELLLHVQNCFRCKMEILEVAEIVDQLNDLY